MPPVVLARDKSAMLQLKLGVFEVSRQTNVDEAGADIPVSLHPPRKGQITPLTHRKPTRNTGSGDTLAHVIYEEVILDLCGNVDATGRMSGKREPGLDILRRRQCMKQPPNLGFDAEIQLNRPGTLWSSGSRPHRQVGIRKRLRDRCRTLSQHTIDTCNRDSTIADLKRFVTKPLSMGRVASLMRCNQ